MNLKEAQDRQKSYMDKQRKYKYDQIGDHVYLKVKVKQSSLSLGRCGKLAPRFCGPFEILANKGQVAYEIALPAHVSVRNVFHASLLKNKFMTLSMSLLVHYYRWNLKGNFPLILCIYWTREKSSFRSAL